MVPEASSNSLYVPVIHSAFEQFVVIFLSIRVFIFCLDTFEMVASSNRTCVLEYIRKSKKEWSKNKRKEVENKRSGIETVCTLI